MSARRLFERIRSERREIWEISDEIERLENIAKGKAIAPQPVVVHTNKLGSNLEDVAIQVVVMKRTSFLGVSSKRSCRSS